MKLCFFSIEEILADSEESDIETEVTSKDKPKNKNKKKKKASSTWIQEDGDNIVDFTDVSAAKKITGILLLMLFFFYCIVSYIHRREISFTSLISKINSIFILTIVIAVDIRTTIYFLNANYEIYGHRVVEFYLHKYQ